MIEITEKNKKECCGCTACANICPKNAIIMKEDEEGFLYPVVDRNKCIKCGLCKKICPILNRKSVKNNPQEYVMRTKQKEVLDNSTSGGFFTPIAEEFLKNKGIIIGVAAYGEKNRISHIIVTNKKDLELLRGSKYVQSYLGDTFRQIKEFLDEGKLVLFSGTPCQVEGLLSFLKKDYKNLYTIDLICHGVPSPKLWKLYVEYQEKKYSSKIKKVNFRNKTYGYHSGTMKLEFENNKKYYGSARVDYMLKSFFTEISSRPACYQCAFKKKNHLSDFTIFDCWSAGKLVDKIKDDDRGYTNVFVNTEKGKEILEKIKNNIEYYPANIEDAINFDGPMVENSAIPHNKREIFYKILNQEGIEGAINKCIPISKKDKFIELSKKFLYKTKLLKLLKK